MHGLSTNPEYLIAYFASLQQADAEAASAARQAAIDAGADKPHGLWERMSSGILEAQGIAWAQTAKAQERFRAAPQIQATKGSLAYLQGLPGNAYTHYLLRRFGTYDGPRPSAGITLSATGPTKPVVMSSTLTAELLAGWRSLREQPAIAQWFVAAVFLVWWLVVGGYAISDDEEFRVLNALLTLGVVTVFATVPTFVTILVLLTLLGGLRLLIQEPLEVIKLGGGLLLVLGAGGLIGTVIGGALLLLTLAVAWAGGGSWPDHTNNYFSGGAALGAMIVAMLAALPLIALLVDHAARGLEKLGFLANGTLQSSAFDPPAKQPPKPVVSLLPDPGPVNEEAMVRERISPQPIGTVNRFAAKRFEAVLDNDESPIDILSQIARTFTYLESVEPWKIIPTVQEQDETVSFTAHGTYKWDFSPYLGEGNEGAQIVLDVSGKSRGGAKPLHLICAVRPEDEDRLRLVLTFTEPSPATAPMWLQWQAEALVANTLDELTQKLAGPLNASIAWNLCEGGWASYNPQSRRPRV